MINSIGLVLGCIGTDLCKEIIIFHHFSRSTRLSHLCTARDWKISAKIRQTFSHFCFFFFCKNRFFSSYNLAEMWKSLTNFCRDFQSRVVQRCDNLVDLEKCWKTTIYLQRSVPIQPRTSPVKFDHLAEKSEIPVRLPSSLHLIRNSGESPMHLSP